MFAVTETEKKENKRKQFFTFSAKYGAVPVENANSKQKTANIFEKENETLKNATNGEIQDKPVNKKLRLFNHPGNVKRKSLLQIKNTDGTTFTKAKTDLLDLRPTNGQHASHLPNQLNNSEAKMDLFEPQPCMNIKPKNGQHTPPLAIQLSSSEAKTDIFEPPSYMDLKPTNGQHTPTLSNQLNNSETKTDLFEPQSYKDLSPNNGQYTPPLPNQLNYSELPILSLIIGEQDLETGPKLSRLEKLAHDPESSNNLTEKLVPVELPDYLQSFEEAQAHFPSITEQDILGEQPKHSILQSTQPFHVVRVAVNLLKSFSSIPKLDDHLTSSTSDSGYVSAEYSIPTCVTAKCSRPLPTDSSQFLPSSEKEPEAQLLNITSQNKTKKKLSKNTSPTKRKNQSLKSPNNPKNLSLKKVSPTKHKKQYEESLSTTNTHNERNELEVKRIASFDDTEQLEDFLSSHKTYNIATTKKSTKVRNISLEKKIAREKHQQSCKTYRANKKIMTDVNLLELVNQTKRNQILQQKEKRLREKVDKLKEYYLYALKNNCFNCTNI